MKLYFTNVKQNTAVKIADDAFSMSAKQALFDLVGQRPSSLIFNLEQVIKPFLFWNIYFTFFLPVVDCTFCKNTVKGNCMLSSFHVHVS